MKLLPIILAGNASTPNDRIILVFPYKNPTQSGFTTNGESFRVVSTVNGEAHKETYSGSLSSISFVADANTPIFIYGGITAIAGLGATMAFSKIIVRSAIFTSYYDYYAGNVGSALKYADFSNCTNLSAAKIMGQTALETFLIRNTPATDVETGNNIKTFSVDGSNNIKILALYCNNLAVSVDSIIAPLSNLEELRISYGRLSEVFAPKNANLNQITIENMSGANSVDFSQLNNLSTVTLRILPDMSSIMFAAEAKISSFTAESLSSLPAIDIAMAANSTLFRAGTSASLESIIVRGATSISRFEVSICSALHTISGIENVSMEQLSLDYLPALDAVNADSCNPSARLVVRNLQNCEEINLSSAILDVLSSVNMYFTDLPGVVKIKCRAQNSDFATKVAGVITAAEANNGVVYLNDQDTYYSTVETAALAKGWTIEPLA